MTFIWKKVFIQSKLLWESYAVSIGKMITARMLNGNIEGKAIGITDDGVLLMEDEEGEIHHVYSADIELLKLCKICQIFI